MRFFTLTKDGCGVRHNFKRVAPRATPPREHVASLPRTGMWWFGIEAKVAPRSHAPGGGANAGQATTAPEAGGEAAGVAMGHGVGDYRGGS